MTLHFFGLNSEETGHIRNKFFSLIQCKITWSSTKIFKILYYFILVCKMETSFIALLFDWIRKKLKTSISPGLNFSVWVKHSWLQQKENSRLEISRYYTWQFHLRIYRCQGNIRLQRGSPWKHVFTNLTFAVLCQKFDWLKKELHGKLYNLLKTNNYGGPLCFLCIL